MMRNFRGKRVDNGELVYGSYVQLAENHYIIPNAIDARWVEVIPESVGQSTGKDNLWGGDFVLALRGAYKYKGVIKYNTEECSFVIANKAGYLLLNYFGSIEVIGNTTDNPDWSKT